MSSFFRIVKSPDPAKCFPLDETSLGEIFERSKKKGSRLRRNSNASDIILSPDSECFGSSREETGTCNQKKEMHLAKTYFNQAYGYYRRGINASTLMQVIESIDLGLECNPSGDIKIGLLFLKALVLYQSALELKEWLDQVPKSPLRDQEGKELDELHQKFTDVSTAFIEIKMPDENRDLLEKIQEIRSKQWPILN